MLEFIKFRNRNATLLSSLSGSQICFDSLDFAHWLHHINILLLNVVVDLVDVELPHVCSGLKQNNLNLFLHSVERSIVDWIMSWLCRRAYLTSHLSQLSDAVVVELTSIQSNSSHQMKTGKKTAQSWTFQNLQCSKLNDNEWYINDKDELTWSRRLSSSKWLSDWSRETKWLMMIRSRVKRALPVININELRIFPRLHDDDSYLECWQSSNQEKEISWADQVETRRHTAWKAFASEVLKKKTGKLGYTDLVGGIDNDVCVSTGGICS